MLVPNLREYPAIEPLPRHSEDVDRAPTPAPGGLSLASLISALTLVGLIGGLGYGGHALLRDLQRVGFESMPRAPKLFAEAALIAPPAVDWARAAEVQPAARKWEAVFLTAPPAATPPALPGRDGPISAIDPETSGLFASARAGASDSARPPREAESRGLAGPGFRTPDGPNGGMRITLSPEAAAVAEPALSAALSAAPTSVVLHATDEVWVRVRDGEAVIYEGILPPGGQYELPDRVTEPLLRAGNAGALYVLVNGTPYGPAGSSTAVLKNVSLRAENVAGRMRQASAMAVCSDVNGMPLLRTAANVGR